MNQKKKGLPHGFRANGLNNQQTSKPHPHQPGAVQPKMATTPQMQRQPVAPPVYRPQPTPRVLQQKALTLPGASQNRRAPAVPPVYRPQPTPKVLQAKRSAEKFAPAQCQVKGRLPSANASCHPTLKQAVQPKMAAAMQLLRQPAAPPVYRPQPVPKVLQTKQKSVVNGTAADPNGRKPIAPPVYKPGNVPKVLQRRTAASRLQTAPQSPGRHGAVVSPKPAMPPGAHKIGDAPHHAQRTAMAKPSDNTIQPKVGFEFETKWDLKPSGSFVNDSLVRNETLVTGAGWTLASDSSGAVGNAEFKTRPFDETEPLNAVTAVMQNMRAFCDHLMTLTGPTVLKGMPGVSVGFWKNNTTITPYPPQQPVLEAAPQMTSGVGTDKLLTLIANMGNPQHPLHLSGADDDVRSELKKVAKSVNKAKNFSPNLNTPQYKGLIALMASYIKGSMVQARRYQDAYNYAMDYPHMEWGEDYDDNEDYQKTVTRGTPPPYDYAKSIVPTLSRTNLGTVARTAFATMPYEITFRHFLGSVLLAAGLDEADKDQRLFPFGVTNGTPGRTIEQHPNITIAQWVKGIWDGADYEWNETPNSQGGSFGLEEVGPQNLHQRPTGPAIELRTLGMSDYTQWRQLAEDLFQYVQQLNT
jgi:hypothetical protein